MKDLTREQLQEILEADELNLFKEDLTDEDAKFAHEFSQALLDWFEKYPENKKLFSASK